MKIDKQMQYKRTIFKGALPAIYFNSTITKASDLPSSLSINLELSLVSIHVVVEDVFNVNPPSSIQEIGKNL